VRARRLEEALGTPAKIFYKDESVSPPGSHKPNTAVAQAYYNAREGVARLTTETGAGQWGSALSFASRTFGLECTVYMVRVSYDQKPYRRTMMQLWGGTVYPSPSEQTEVGRALLAQDPDTNGSLGMAISEAVVDAATRDDSKYALGSVLNHVLLHQTVIGLEAQEQMAMAGESPDVVIGCCGGGSNLAGLVLPYVPEKLGDRPEMRFVAVEPSACPTLSKGRFLYDYGDTAKTTPLLKMFTLGHTFVPPGIHAGGLRYHGCAPIVSALVDQGLLEARNVHQRSVFEAGQLFAQTEGLIVAPETAHAVRAAIDEALVCKETGEPKTILFNLSGHGHVDMLSYEAFLSGRLEDYAYPEDAIARATAELTESVPEVEG
jgi:tryptophan synthase beta chain